VYYLFVIGAVTRLIFNKRGGVPITLPFYQHCNEAMPWGGLKIGLLGQGGTSYY